MLQIGGSTPYVFFSKIGGSNKKENPYRAQYAIPGGAVTEREVERAVKRLKDNKGLGPEGVSNEALKATCPILKGIWAQLLNILLVRRIWPSLLRIAKVIPFAKSGKDHTQGEGYRYIHLLSHIAKLLQGIIDNRLRRATRFNPFQRGYVA